MSALILLLLAVCLALLILEDRQVRRDRSELVHVVYVNGIRGKSTVTRMIDGGLRAGGWKVFCKTTGTVPMVIGVDGTARPLVRRGGPTSANRCGSSTGRCGRGPRSW